MTHDPKDALQAALRQLEAAGSPSAARDASALMDIVQGDAPPWTELSDDQVAHLQRLIARRARREPISHISGKRAFWMHEFEVTPDVLDPRPDTETLLEVALKHRFDTVLDLGTGSGCILLSLLHERPAALGIGTDLSEAALAVAKRNADRVGVADRVSWAVSDWFSSVTGTYDLIVSNPPYIALDEMAGLAPELDYEPRMALTDEQDGLSAYRAITQDAMRHLNPQGRLLVEIGPTQAAAVSDLFARAGLVDLHVHQDLDGRDRVVSGANLPRTDQ
ncbi:MAG: peptide chain release factor N(5)-glutamine methyltransferase [Marivita sp.]|uniref:peptide chain release factor N(5)-glutamine methyltransferase n=1 Tax=Marivita sp. TaxID=2003365 RepID=UPI001B21E677|nr:peptide chain release factor N(5)-glutamine methyltransferase [Marivita sp.]MBO6882746.1 peptide chain release factor N(5)-glutamine methyltransferase [Marivita sp.]